jgi:hypothetical protein
MKLEEALATTRMRAAGSVRHRSRHSRANVCRLAPLGLFRPTAGAACPTACAPGCLLSGEWVPGSTRTRIILAFHAAVVETSLMMGGVHPRLLVLDAPRQHELDASDLRSYIKRFLEISAKQAHPVQLVLSAIDPEIIPGGCMDAIWEPPFKFNDKPRFLGPSPKMG